MIIILPIMKFMSMVLLVVNSTWVSGNVSYALDLTLGTHNIELVVVDVYGVSTSYQTNVFVSDPLPIFDSIPEDSVSVIENGDLVTVSWQVSDNNLAYYLIYLDDQIMKNSSVVDDISFVLSNLTFGEYNLRLEVFDYSNNMIDDSLTVIVIDQTAPVLVNSSAEELVFEMNQEVLIDVEAYDLNPDNITVYLDNSVYQCLIG